MITQTPSQLVVDKIIQEIQTHGPMTFARYMELALYAPGLGYYSSGLQKFGEQGDFVTAPELSPLFSYCVARQCQQVLSTTSGNILEFGAGSGAMAAAILQKCHEWQCLPQHYYILELSAELQQRQRTTITKAAPELIDRVVWLSTLPDKFNGIVLANEVLDAMPVHQFVIQDGIKERFVNYQDQQLTYHVDQPHHPLLTQQVNALNLQLPQHYQSEINLILPSWLTSIAECLQRGVVLLIDYGFPRHEYYHPQRSAGTIMCHYQHTAHPDALLNPGLQDITSHVDFTAVAEAAINVNFNVAGYTNQAAFLMNCGIAEFINRDADEVELYRQNQQIKRLTLPSEMGELFKVIALEKSFPGPLIGFQAFDKLATL